MNTDLTLDVLTLPVDLAAVQSDDALLDFLGTCNPRTAPTDDVLARLLLAWRRAVDAGPIPELVGLGQALDIVAEARYRRSLLRQLLSPLGVPSGTFQGTQHGPVRHHADRPLRWRLFRARWRAHGLLSALMGRSIGTPAMTAQEYDRKGGKS